MEDNKIRVGITQGDIKDVCRPGDAGIVHADYLRFA